MLRVNAKVLVDPDRKSHPNRRRPRGTHYFPMVGYSFDSWSFRPDPRTRNGRPSLSPSLANLGRHSSTPSADYSRRRNRILRSTNDQGTRGQLCGLATTQGDCMWDTQRSGIPAAKVELL